MFYDLNFFFQIIVEDINDNDPVFEEAQYRGRVAEDASTGTSVLRTRATDPDLGPNGKILYSLANQTHSLFSIDNKTGVIYTIGLVCQSSYYLR